MVLSDCDTFPDLIHSWGWAADPPQAAALVLRAGNDMNCGVGFSALVEAEGMGYVDRGEIAAAATRALRERMRAGDLQPVGSDPWAGAYPLSVVGSEGHTALVERLVAGGTVLMHARKGALPIRLTRAVEGARAAGGGAAAGTPPSEGATPAMADTLSSPSLAPHVFTAPPPFTAPPFLIALVGPSADDASIQAHTYHGTPARWFTLRQALQEEILEQKAEAQLGYERGCATTGDDR